MARSASGKNPEAMSARQQREEQGGSMRGIRVVVIGLLAIAASSAIATTSASAALPELGRCVNKGSGGAYKYKNCVKTDPSHNGAWEWEPGPGANGKFEAGGIFEARLETVGHVPIACGPTEIEGHWLDGKKASVEIFLHGCQDAQLRACTTPEVGPQKESEIKNTEPIEGEICFISGKGGLKPKVGIDLKSKSAAPMLTFTCSTPPTTFPPSSELWTVEGSLIGELKPVDRMKTESKAVFRAVAGKQIPEKFEEGVKDVPIAKRGFPTPSTEEDAGITLREEHKTIFVESSEALEIKAK
jgi:hypothetical protein